MRSRDLEANGLTFRVREHGDGSPVVLLHGFPETSRMWEPLMERLAGEGFRCLAPDQRGYSPGARPAAVSEYKYRTLAADVFGFMDAMGWQRAHLIGHDWGAMAGWAAVGTKPERVLSWTAMSMPHIIPFSEQLRRSKEQNQPSPYDAIFRDDGSAEAGLSANGYQAIRALYQATHPPDEIEDYISVLSQEGALTAALNWYRSSEGLRFGRDDGNEWGKVATPTLHIWGKSDSGRDATLATKDYMAGPYELLELDCGHWIVQEAFDDVVGPIAALLKEHSETPEEVASASS